MLKNKVIIGKRKVGVFFMSILLGNKCIKHIIPVKETYYGKSKEFIKIENELKKIIDMVRDDEKKSIFKSRTDIDNSSPNQNIQDIFTKYFKIKGIKIHWSDNVPNAYTIIVSLPIMYLVNQQKLQENKKFINDELSIYIFLSTTLISTCDLNEKELLAIILHEIGHNFTITPFYFISTLPLLMVAPFGWLLSPLIQTGISELMIAIGNFFKKHLPFIYNFKNMLENFLSSISGALVVSPEKLFRIVQLLPVYMFEMIPGYYEEKFSDTFAASYGYGKDLSSALYKLSNQKKSLYNKVIVETPIINLVADFYKIIIDCVISFIDPHPNVQTRIVVMIDKLKRDLDDPNIPKDLKIELKNNIKYIEDYYNEFYLNDPYTKKHKVFTQMTLKLYDKILGTKDWRSGMSNFFKNYEA